jgi:hypothetical protein
MRVLRGLIAHFHHVERLSNYQTNSSYEGVSVPCFEPWVWKQWHTGYDAR